MSLDQLVSKTITSKVVKNVPVYVPPEYGIDRNDIGELVQVFNASNRRAKLAEVIRKYISENNPTRKNYDGIISISEIVEVDGQFFTDLTFDSDKAGLTALYIYKAEDLQLVFVSNLKGAGGIQHVVLTYLPS